MAFTFIPNSDIDPGSPLTTELMTALRDNDEFLEANFKTWELLEHKELSADATTASFTGLDGNVDFVYRLQGRIKKDSGGGSLIYELRPNGVTSAQTSLISAHLSGADVNTTAGATLPLGLAATGDLFVQFDAIFYAAVTVQTVAFARALRSLSMAMSTTMNSAHTIFSMWNETSTNITSLDVFSTVASQLRQGTHITLYRMKPK